MFERGLEARCNEDVAGNLRQGCIVRVRLRNGLELLDDVGHEEHS